MMRKVLEQLVLIITSFVAGFELFKLSGVHGYALNGCGGCLVWGRPFYYRIIATGTGGGLAMEPQFALDLIFWFVLSLAAIEALAILASQVSRRIPAKPPNQIQKIEV